MRLRFQKWLATQIIPDAAAKLFSEAITCYRSEAYRAAMVMSYIGFQVILKERILSATVPTGIAAPRWNQIQAELKNEDKWDATVKDVVQTKNPAEIFLINDDLRNQVTYWKDRRNDCAHFKSNDIEYYHIEAFWAFLESNLAKFMVNGSFGALINKIEKHFDVSQTAPGLDAKVIAGEIAAAIKTSDLQNFFEDLHSSFNNLFGYISNEELSFYNDVFLVSNNDVKTALANHLKSNTEMLLDYLREYPQKLTELNLDSSFIRNLWYSILFTSGKNDFGVYYGLLHSAMIPEEDILDAHRQILQRIGNVKPNNDHEKMELERRGFFTELKRRLFEDGMISQFAYSNQRAGLISYYLENYLIDEQVARGISNTFNASYHPRILASVLTNMFSVNGIKRQEYIDIAKGHAISLPRYIPSIK